jgi:adenylosuccinate lyase
MDGLLVFPERMRTNLDATRGLLYSQAVLLAMIDAGLSRDDAYVIVQRAAAAAWERDESFEDVLLREPEVSSRIPAGKLHELFDPAPYVKNLDGVFARLEKLKVDAAEPAGQEE